MGTQECVISPVRKKRLEKQGYTSFTDAELYDLKFGIRLAYYACGSIVILGLLLTDTRILGVSLALAFFGMFPPYHPVDYLYNYAIRHWLNKPKLPPRPPQGRFACIIATIFLGIIIYLLMSGFLIGGYILGGALVASAVLVSTMDICIPSMIYNRLFGRSK